MPSTAPTFGSAGIALLTLALICWLIMVIYLFGFVGKQVQGDAVVGQAFAFFGSAIFCGLCWLWLGGLLLKAGSQDMLPGWVSTAAIVLYLASGVAAGIAFSLMSDPKFVWPVIVPVALPPILGFYVLSLYVPSIYFGDGGARAVWGSVLILSIAPWPMLLWKLGTDQKNRVENAKAQSEWETQERAPKREENLGTLKRMTPDARVMDWYPLLEEEGGVRTEALEALRHIERRQADIEDMLGYGIIRAMTLLPELDLQPTPQLCGAAKAYFLKHAKETRIREKQDPRPYAAGGYVEDSMPGLRWLLAHGCNCDESIAAMETSISTYQDSPDRQKALAALREIRANQ